MCVFLEGEALLTSLEKGLNASCRSLLSFCWEAFSCLSTVFVFFSYRKLQNLVAFIALVGPAVCFSGIRSCMLEKNYHFSKRKPFSKMVNLNYQDAFCTILGEYFTSTYKHLTQSKLSQWETFHLLHPAHYMTTGDSS